MSTLLFAWLGVQLAFAVAATAAAALPALPPRRRVAALRALIGVALVAPAVAALVPPLPVAAVREVAPQVYSAVDAGVRVVSTSAPPLAGAGEGSAVVPSVLAGSPAAAAALLVGGLGLARLLVDLVRVRRALGGLVPVRSVGRVRIAVSSRAAAPFAVWTPRASWVVLDVATWADPGERRAAVHHELGHHRGRDPQGTVLLALVGVLAWPNPAWHALVRSLAAAEEEAADASAARRVGSLPFARALAAAAHRAAGAPFAPPLSAALLSRSLLSRRIAVLVSPPRPASPVRSTLALALALAGTALVSPVLLAPLGAAPDAFAAGRDPARTDAAPVAAELSPDALARVQAIVARSAGEGMALRDDPAVLRLLTRYRAVDTAGAWIRGGVDAREAWRPLVDGALADAGLPPALAAVPLVESRYTNWGAPGEDVVSSAAPGSIPGRGLWMFIPSTARAYGLRVDGAVDERLDPVRETGAAVALLSDLYARFGDWDLALAGYNQGAAAVDAAIDAGGTRDAFRLAEAGLLNSYVAQVHAAALVLADPSLVP